MASEAANFADVPSTLTKPQLGSCASVPKTSRESPEPAQNIELSDEFLLDQLSRGNQSALVLLFRRYARMVRSVAYRIIRDAAEADDLLQEVFLFIFRKSSLFDPERGSA